MSNLIYCNESKHLLNIDYNFDHQIDVLVEGSFDIPTFVYDFQIECAVSIDPFYVIETVIAGMIKWNVEEMT